MNAPKIRPGAWVAAFNKHYPAFLSFLYGLGDVLVTTSQTLIVSLGTPALLVLLLYVEHERVKHGIALFEANPSLASWAAWALVFANTSLQFLIHYVETKAGYHQPRRAAFSLRIFWHDVRYFFGGGNSWQPRELSPAHDMRRVLRLVTFAILALALVGSMAGAMEDTPGAWYEGILSILTESTLLEFVTWVGGLMFTLAAVRLVHVNTDYLARKYAEVANTTHAPTSAPALPDHGQDAPADEQDTQPTAAIVSDELEAVGSADFLPAPAPAKRTRNRKA